LQSAFKDWKLSDWAHKIVRSATLAAPLPKAVARAASEKSHVHILSEDEGNMMTLCAHKQGQARPRELKDPDIASDKLEAIAWFLPFVLGAVNVPLPAFCCSNLIQVPCLCDTSKSGSFYRITGMPAC
jgi:hypothetical protein